MKISLFSWLRTTNSFWAKALIGAVGGALAGLAYPRFDLWYLTYLGLPLVLLAIHRLGLFRSLWVGTIAGTAFYCTQLTWISLYLGPVPLIALSIMEGLFFGIGAVGISLAWRFIDQRNLGRQAAFFTAAIIATIWVGREYLSGHFPFSGFPWARIGVSQANTPLANLVYWVDIAGLSWLIVYVCALLTLRFIQAPASGSGLAKRAKNYAPVAAAGLVLYLAAVATVIPTAAEAGTMNIAAAQGNANAGLFAVNPPGSILLKHIQASRKLLATNHIPIDVMVWPENASDLDPISMPRIHDVLNNFVKDELHGTLIFGTKTIRDSKLYNEVVQWTPTGGAVDWYDKKIPVPFGEYVPNRSFFMALAPSLIGMIVWDMSPGTRDGIFETPKGKLGSLICFEVVFDELSADLVDGGAEALLVQTNNSDFGHSDETFQQVAVSRLRAIETGRSVVAVSTVGVSAIYRPDGTTQKILPVFKPGAMVDTVALRTSKTPAMIFGRYIEIASFFAALLLVLISAIAITARKFRKS